MRVLVTGTGRCGTHTFARACEAIANYTRSHERVWQQPIGDKLVIPGRHIEVGCPYYIALPILIERYEDLRVVHLVRDRLECVRSLVNLRNTAGDWALTYWGRFLYHDATDLRSRVAQAGYYYDCVNALIGAVAGDRLLLRFELEQWRRDWPTFWARVKAEGDYDESVNTWGDPDRWSLGRHDERVDETDLISE